MIRAVLEILAFFIFISLLRSVLVVIAKAFSSILRRPAPVHPAAAGPRKVADLKRDPVCGIFVSTETSIKLNIDGDVVHFCSDACCQKYRESARAAR